MKTKFNNNTLLSLPNIGDAFVKKLGRIGITTKEEFLACDPYEVYEEMLEQIDPSLCRCALATLVGAKKGVPWHKITKQATAEYQKRHPEHQWKDNR
ncbi:MAG: TfoX/Sxy family DNA transformation protein [Phycisphaerae bacterium]|nr:TfoX/Sxy family DNA transformation protein [Phycisphaerae bacterium]